MTFMSKHADEEVDDNVVSKEALVHLNAQSLSQDDLFQHFSAVTLRTCPA